MRIWTIQSEDAWTFLNRHGRLEARPEHQSRYWSIAYQWMRDQLVKRIGPPHREDAAPLWGWSQWSGEGRKRPDLRSVRHEWGPPGRYVMIECELPNTEVVLSDSDAWVIVLNDGYIAASEEESDAFYAEIDRHGCEPRAPWPPPLEARIRASWERVIDFHQLGGPGWHPMEKRSIQACFWKLDMDQVISCKPFVVHPKRRKERS